MNYRAGLMRLSIAGAVLTTLSAISACSLDADGELGAYTPPQTTPTATPTPTPAMTDLRADVEAAIFARFSTGEGRAQAVEMAETLETVLSVSPAQGDARAFEMELARDAICLADALPAGASPQEAVTAIQAVSLNTQARIDAYLALQQAAGSRVVSLSEIEGGATCL